MNTPIEITNLEEAQYTYALKCALEAAKEGTLNDEAAQFASLSIVFYCLAEGLVSAIKEKTEVVATAIDEDGNLSKEQFVHFFTITKDGEELLNKINDTLKQKR